MAKKAKKVAAKKPAKKVTTKPVTKKVVKATPAPKPTPQEKATEQEKVEQLQHAAPPEVNEDDVKAARQRTADQLKAHAEEVARLGKLGLVEVPVRGSPYTLVGMADPQATPTTEQRVEIAKRLNAVGPKLPRYLGMIGHLIDEKKPVASAQAVVRVASNIANGIEHAKEAAKAAAKAAKAKPAAKSTTGKKSAAAAPAASTTPKKKGTGGEKTRNLEVPKVPKEGFSKTNKPATSGELIRARIMEHKLTDEQIAAEVRKLFEGRNTQVSDVRWNRGQLRKKGVDAPDPVGEETPKKGGK